MEPTMTRGKPTRIRPARLLAAVSAIASLAACTVGPDYQRPEVAPPGEFRSQIGPADASSFADLPWWDVYSDPALQALVNEGLENNYDLAIAAARIEQARALVG